MSVLTAPAAITDTLAALAGGDGLAGAINALDDKISALVTTDITDITSTYTELNVLDGIPATLTATELGYVDGVTSAIQTQIGTKQATITGAATTIDTEDLTASRAIVSNASGKVAVATTTSTEIGYVNGVTSAIQTQLDDKEEVTASTSVASDATPNPTGGSKRNEYYLTALEEAAEFAEPSGTPANGNMLMIRTLDDGTGRALTYNDIYDGLYDTLPATTTASKTLYMLFIYNSEATKWEMLSYVEEA